MTTIFRPSLQFPRTMTQKTWKREDEEEVQEKRGRNPLTHPSLDLQPFVRQATEQKHESRVDDTSVASASDIVWKDASERYYGYRAKDRRSTAGAGRGSGNREQISGTGRASQ